MMKPLAGTRFTVEACRFTPSIALRDPHGIVNLSGKTLFIRAMTRIDFSRTKAITYLRFMITHLSAL